MILADLLRNSINMNKLSCCRSVLILLAYLLFLLLIWSQPISGGIGGHLIKAKRQKVTMTKNQYWTANNCLKFRNLFKFKKLAMDRLTSVIKKVSNDKTIAPEEMTFQVNTFGLFQKELNESESLVFQSLSWLENTLKGDYKDLMDMTISTKDRLDALKDATLKEEQEYNELLKAGKFVEEMKILETRQNHTQIQRVIDDILDDIAKAADQLEQDLDEHVFDQAVKDSQQGKKANIEAVVRLEERDVPADGGQYENSSKIKPGHSGVIKLVDSKDNQFVLSKGKDSTVPHEDHHFIRDVIYLVLLCTICGWACSVLRLPTMFGYIISGIVLGPSGLNILKSLVQLETLGEFGVFFILFSVGLEFSPEKLRKVFRVASAGTLLMMGLMIVCGLAVGHFMSASPNESAFVASCLSLSSTPLIVKFLGSHKEGSDATDNLKEQIPPPHHSRSKGGLYDYGSVLLGILIMQDVLLGVLMALLPSLAGTGTDNASARETQVYLKIMVKIGAALVSILVICIVASRFLIGPFYHYLLTKMNKEILILATVTLAFLMLMLTDYLEISMELGCFMAGVLVSSKGPELSDLIEKLIQPLKDFLACLFFASIGLHVFPSFLLYEMTILTTLTMAIVGAKYVIGVVVLALLLPSGSSSIKWVVSAGLAQVSEFSFVLGSRARRLGLISREVYLLILSITTLSLLCAPVLWKATLWYQRIKHHASDKAGVNDLAPTTVVINASTPEVNRKNIPKLT